MNWLRVLTGLVLWCGAVAALAWSFDRRLVAEGGVRTSLAPALWSYAAGPRPTFEIEARQPLLLAVGDPIFVVDGPGRLRQIGEIRRVSDRRTGRLSERAPAESAEALIYPGNEPLPPDAELLYYSTPDSMLWVVETMLPPEKREQIAAEISAALEAHRDEILAELRPIAERSIREALLVVQEDLAASIERHRPQLERLGSRYQRELVDQEVVPLVQEEIWPIVRDHAEPAANEIGLEIWARVSLWRFTWRYLYDVAPLPERRRLEHEWQRFLNEEAFPIFEAHSDDFVAVVQRSLSDAAKNPKVQSAARRNLTKILNDPELQRIVWAIFRETVVENPRLHEVLERHWTSPEAQAALQIAAERVQPTVHRIGELMFGTRDGGITPEFAAVLRNRILGKDRRWLVVAAKPASGSVGGGERSRNGPLRIRRGVDAGVNPFVMTRGEPQ